MCVCCCGRFQSWLEEEGEEGALGNLKEEEKEEPTGFPFCRRRRFLKIARSVASRPRGLFVREKIFSLKKGQNGKDSKSVTDSAP